MFGVSKSSYYSWIARQQDKDGSRSVRRASRDRVREMMRQIIAARNGAIPGKRTFKAELFRRFGEVVNTKRIRSLMREMNLVATKPKRDAYKHQATHNHPCAAPENKVCQDFFIGPRRVILTDITYLYYGEYRNPFYLCVFRDAYTRENLGWAIDRAMDTAFVKRACEMMMEKHGDELKGEEEVYIHSDQGSQYLSTEYKELLEDDGFIQSVSGRGNSQDNAPMESFFARLKTALMDLVARCWSFDDAAQMVDKYLDKYNSLYYQYDLAGLTPEEFYEYATTGIYPLPFYYGISADKLMAVGDLTKVRRAYADKEAAKRREAARKKNAAKKLINPARRVKQDIALLERKIREWGRSKEQAETQIDHLKRVLEKCRKAGEYIKGQTAEVLEKLADPLAWREHEELDYVFDMNELF